MGYAVYEDRDARDYGVERWAGYGVPGECDWKDCSAKINRGLAYKCEEHLVYNDFEDETDAEWDERREDGCGLYFCPEHIGKITLHDGMDPKPDTPEWIEWMLTDESWEEWRTQNPERVKVLEVVG